MIRTKILATMGPACADVETLVRLFEAGADVCRLNFSHGAPDQHEQILTAVRSAEFPSFDAAVTGRSRLSRVRVSDRFRMRQLRG